MKIRAFAIIKEKGKFLLIREANPKWKNKWFVPGGKVEKTETLAEGAIREAREETGFDCVVSGIFFMKYYPAEHDQSGLHIFFEGRTISGALKYDNDDHSLEAGWFDMLEIEQMETRNELPDILKRYSQEVPLFSMEQIQFVG